MSAQLSEQIRGFLDKNYPCACGPDNPDCNGNQCEADEIIDMFLKAGYVFIDEEAAAKEHLQRQFGADAWDRFPHMREIALGRVREAVNLLKGAKQ